MWLLYVQILPLCNSLMGPLLNPHIFFIARSCPFYFLSLSPFLPFFSNSIAVALVPALCSLSWTTAPLTLCISSHLLPSHPPFSHQGDISITKVPLRHFKLNILQWLLSCQRESKLLIWPIKHFLMWPITTCPTPLLPFCSSSQKPLGTPAAPEPLLMFFLFFLLVSPFYPSSHTQHLFVL